VPRVILDLYKLKRPYCGLGQFCLHLGRAVAAQAHRAGVQPVFFVGRSRARLVRAPGVRYEYAWPWRKERFFRRLRPVIERCLPRRPADTLWHATDQFCKHWPVDPRVPVLLTIHDLTFLWTDSGYTPEEHRRRLQKKVDRASALATDSEFSAQEIRKALDLKGKPLRVVYCGATIAAHDRLERPKFVPPGKFLFSIGTLAPRKNFHVLVELLRRLPEYRLILAGDNSEDYARQIERMVGEAGLTSRFLMPGEISDAHRTWLYENCDALLFPSLSEGFGLPVVEAMAHGKPVFLSDRTSLPEVGGSLGFYWRSFSPDHMLGVFQTGMATFRKDPEYARKLVAHAKSFSWQRTAAEYVKLYVEMLAGAGERGRDRAPYP
jgi:glycosyltransferase involved in cell wall biosynthesis